MMPLLVWKKDSRLHDVAQYFESLIEFSYVLRDAGLGNLGEGKWAPLARNFVGRLKARGLFRNGSSAVAAAVPYVVDALGALGTIQYSFRPELSSYYRENPDVDALLGHAGYAMGQLGLGEKLIFEPAAADHEFIMARRSEVGALVDPSFFAEPLWPRSGAHLKHIGVPFAFTVAVQDPWLESLRGAGLDGLVRSYLDLMEGMHVKQEDSNPRSVTPGSVTITLGKGAVFNGPVAIGQNITASLQIASEAQNDQLRESLDLLVRQMGDILSNMKSESQQDEVSNQLQAFVSEATKENPNKWTLSASAAAFLAVTKQIGPVTESITNAVDKVLSYLGSG